MKISDIIRRNFTAISPEYEQFAREKDACRQCSIYDCYKQVGQGEGNASDPNFMIIGEAFGKEECEQVRPFVGRAGQRIRSELRKYPHCFDKSNTLISNVLACRPENNVFPRDGQYNILEKNRKKSRAKTREIVNFCATNWVRREIELLHPKIIIILGAKALEYIRGDSGITANRGAWKFSEKYKAWTMATYHPSYVLRCQNDPDKDFVPRQFEEDIRKVVTTWSSVVRNDPRTNMSPEEWEHECALKKGSDKHPSKYVALSDAFLGYAVDD